MPRVISGTLVASTPQTITLDAAYSYVEVTNVNGTAPLYFSVNQTAAPTVGGNDCEVVVANWPKLCVNAPGVSATVVKVISSGATTFTVSGRGESS